MHYLERVVSVQSASVRGDYFHRGVPAADGHSREELTENKEVVFIDDILIATEIEARSMRSRSGNLHFLGQTYG